MVSENNSGLGRTLLAFGTGGLSLLPGIFEKRQREEEAKRQQQLQKQNRLSRLERALSGADTPAFLHSEAQTAAQQGNLRPLQDLNRQRTADITSALAGFDPKTAATSALAGLQQAPEQAKQPALSQIGKLQLEIDTGAIPREVGEARIRKLNAPAQPLVQQVGEDTAVKFAVQDLRDDPLFGSKVLNETAASSRSSLNSLQVMENLSKRVESGQVGQFAKFKNVFKKGINALGGKIDVQGIADVEGLIAQGVTLMTSRIKELGTKPTDKDAALTLERVPNIGLSLEGLKQSIALNKELDRKAIEKSTFRRSLNKQRKRFKRDFIGFRDFVDNEMFKFGERKTQEYKLFLDKLIPVPVAGQVAQPAGQVTSQPTPPIQKSQGRRFKMGADASIIEVK